MKFIKHIKEEWRIYVAIPLFVAAGATTTNSGWWHWPVCIVLSALGGRCLGKGIIKLMINEYVDGYIKGVGAGMATEHTSMRGKQ